MKEGYTSRRVDMTCTSFSRNTNHIEPTAEKRNNQPKGLIAAFMEVRAAGDKNS